MKKYIKITLIVIFFLFNIIEFRAQVAIKLNTVDDVIGNSVVNYSGGTYTANLHQLRGNRGYIKISNTKLIQNNNKSIAIWAAGYVDLLPGTEVFATLKSEIRLVGCAITPPSTARMANPNNTLAVKENTNLTANTIYPNPTNGILNVSLASTDDKVNEINVYNITGSLVLSVKDSNIADLSRLASGNYIIKVKTNIEEFTKKIIKE